MATPNPNHVLSIMAFKWRDEPSTPLLLATAFDTSPFNIFSRGKVREFATFASRTVASRSTMNVRASAKQDQYECTTYFYRHPSGITTVVIASQQYPERVAYDLVVLAANAYGQKLGTKLDSLSVDNTSEDSDLLDLLKKYETPDEVDKIMKLQKDLNEVKTIMYENIDKLLQRGEKIDDLVAKSQDLSIGSKAFYGTTKSMNRRCPCVIM